MLKLYSDNTTLPENKSHSLIRVYMISLNPAILGL